MLYWLITICTIVNRDFVIRLRNENEGVWPRLSCENCIVHSWFVWMLWTREEPSLTDSAGIRDSRTRTRDGGGSESERLTEWFTATGNTTERTNERTTLFGELNDANWFAETNHENPSLLLRLSYILFQERDNWLPHPFEVFQPTTKRITDYFKV